jgi:hypothetical protein
MPDSSPHQHPQPTASRPAVQAGGALRRAGIAAKCPPATLPAPKQPERVAITSHHSGADFAQWDRISGQAEVTPGHHMLLLTSTTGNWWYIHNYFPDLTGSFITGGVDLIGTNPSNVDRLVCVAMVIVDEPTYTSIVTGQLKSPFALPAGVKGGAATAVWARKR